MPQVINNILATSNYIPFLIFFLLFLSGFGFPLSEDLVIIAAAIIAKENDHLLFHLYIAIYIGLITSDHIAFWIGYHMGHKIKNMRWFKKILSEKKMLLIQKYLHNHGILTFIICRFIPFGIRNTLFVSSGFSKMNYKLFTIYDLISGVISSSTLYFLIYFLGIDVEKPFKIAGIILFIALAATIFTLILIFFVFRKEKPDDTIADINNSQE